MGVSPPGELFFPMFITLANCSLVGSDFCCAFAQSLRLFGSDCTYLLVLNLWSPFPTLNFDSVSHICLGLLVELLQQRRLGRADLEIELSKKKRPRKYCGFDIE